MMLLIVAILFFTGTAWADTPAQIDRYPAVNVIVTENKRPLLQENGKRIIQEPVTPSRSTRQ